MAKYLALAGDKTEEFFAESDEDAIKKWRPCLRKQGRNLYIIQSG